MNNKKKNKNRQKPTKSVQKVDPVESNKQESLLNVTTELESESENKKDLVTPSVIDVLEDEKNTIFEAPKKPNRVKGKKIIDSQRDDTQNIKIDENKSVENIISLVENTGKPLTVAPKTRKKKNKDKQHNESQEISKPDIDVTEKLDFKEDLETIKEIRDSDKNPPHADKIQGTDSKIMKKKNKKRNRYDSEKSDVVESIESEKESLTYEKNVSNKVTLLDDCNIPSKGDTDTSLDAVVVETTIIPNLNEGEQEESCKIKKRNKKLKQLQQKTDKRSLKKENNVVLSSTKSKQKADCSEPCELSCLDDVISNTKDHKSKDRKLKVMPEKQSTSSENPEDSLLNTTTNVSLLDNIGKTITGTKEKVNIDLVHPQITDKENQEKKLPMTLEEILLDSNQSVKTTFDMPAESLPNKSTTSDKVSPLNIIVLKSEDCKEQANVDKIIPRILDKEKQEEKLFTTIDEVLIDINQSFKTIDEFSDDSFMEVKSTKKKKKQAQRIIVLPKTSICSGENISENSEELKCKENKKNLPLAEEVLDNIAADSNKAIIAVPDIIQYPRSASEQLLFDDANNTIIKEILPTNEINLGISISTSVPIIQGSGETPETKLLQDPLHVKLTETDSKLDKCVQEKTDIKSKMMEVNQDMEELRLSIERSLAELTALDKGDNEYESKFQDKKLNIDDNIILNQEEKESELINFPMPSFLVEKTVIPSEDKETKPNKYVCIAPVKGTTSFGKDDKDEETMTSEFSAVPVCPVRKDNKSKGKPKKKNKQESTSTAVSCTSQQVTSNTNVEEHSSSKKESEKPEQKQKEAQREGKISNQSLVVDLENNVPLDDIPQAIAANFEPIEKFEDALTSSVDDVNQSFEMIASELNECHKNFDNPQVNIIGPIENEEKEKNVKENRVTPPKNLLNHPDIPVPSNKTDYKKEKNKTPNTQRAKVKIKDSVEIEKTEKMSKQSQTYNKRNNLKNLHGSKSFSCMTNGNNEYIYKYSFRKVYLQNFCSICKKGLKQRIPCKFCSLIFYCSQKHMDEDWPQHQPLCFAVSTISHLKDQKHIYADAKGITGQDYRVLRMQMIVSCEKILKRKLLPWEQEVLLYPRICADVNCREWQQSKLKDCKGCEQISYCSDHVEHLPVDHTRWCRSYALYQKLVNYQQTKGRLEPPLPTKILENHVMIPGKINEVLASMYEEKIDMNDIQYAALTQLATSPLTVAYSYQLFTSNVNSATNKLSPKTCFTVHVVGAELQFEADGLSKWEVFLLHLRPHIKDLRIVLIGPDLNPSKLPLDLLGKVKLCESCETNRRRLTFSFHDKLTYHEYHSNDHFITPDIVCAFNPSIQRSSVYNGRDSWPSTIRCILEQKVPFVVTAYTLEELQRDLSRVKELGDFNIVSEAKSNPFASVRPDRNFITDNEIPLLFKNYCLSIVCGI